MNFKILMIIFLFISCGSSPENPVGHPRNPNSDKNEILIGAFNIQVFGNSKIEKSNVVEILVQTLKRYDVVLIQEIRNADGTAIQILLNNLNLETNNQYEMVIGSRAGRTSSKEQHAFFYKKDKLTVKNTHEPTDENDVFEREPFSVLFKLLGTGDEFIATGIHIKPEDVINELNELKNSYSEISSVFNNPDIIFLGDFNADCSYLSNAEFSNLLFTTDPYFNWQFEKNGIINDTTVHDTNCTYDQMITSQGLSEKVKASSKNIFNFWSVFNLTKDEALDVSDHFPIELILSF